MNALKIIDVKIIDERLGKGKYDIKLYEVARVPVSKRLISYNTEIADLRREVGYLERIRCFLNDLFINLESVERLIRHTDNEIDDINDRIKILEYEVKQICEV